MNLLNSQTTVLICIATILLLRISTTNSELISHHYLAFESRPPGDPIPDMPPIPPIPHSSTVVSITRLTFSQGDGSQSSTDIEIWIDGKYPASDFRSNCIPGRFAIWPEDLTDVKYTYFCEDAQSIRSLRNFTYKEGEAILDTRPYFDVGVVNSMFTPYFAHWRFWQADTKRLSACSVRCENTDLQKLYQYRLKRTLAMGGTWAIAIVTVLQLAVVVSIIIMWTPGICKCLSGDSWIENSRILWNDFVKRWFWESPWIDSILDMVHISLIIVVGFCMMEAIGHSDFFSWRTMLMYNAGVSYTYLSLFTLVSSYLHQCAYYLKEKSDELPTHYNNDPITTPFSKTLIVKVSHDWRWQRVFGQIGLLILMGSYLLSVNDYSGAGMDSLVSVILVTGVVACIWSGGDASIVGLQALHTIFLTVYAKVLKKSKSKPHPYDLQRPLFAKATVAAVKANLQFF